MRRSGRSIVALLASSLSLVGAAHAQPERAPAGAAPAPDFDQVLDRLISASGLTAEQAGKRAITTSPAVRRRAAEIDVTYAQAEQAELARVPRIGATLGYTRLSPIDPIPIGPGAEFAFPVNSFVAQGTLMVSLSDYVVRYPRMIDAAKLGTEAARVGKRSAEIDAAQEGRLTYYEWVRARLQILIAERQLAQVRATLGQVRALAEVQRLSKADLMRVESQEAQAEQVLHQLQLLGALREEQLRILIGAPEGEPLAIGEDIRVDLAPPAEAGTPIDDALATARRQRLEFRAFDLGIRAKESAREAELVSQYPRLVAVAAADYARPNQRVFPLREEFNFTWSAGLQLQWTLNDTLVTRAADRRNLADIRQLRADRDALERGTRIEVLAAQQAVLLAQRNLETSQKGLAAAEESYRVRMALLAADRATAVELVDSETDLTRQRIAALNARIDLRVALVQLAHALGEDAR